MNAVTSSQITAIRVMASRAGMDDDTYRDFLFREASVRSTKKLTVVSAGRIIDKLKSMTGQSTWAKGSITGLDSPVAKKMQALWITGWDLGLIRDRTDRAMLSFLERQTGVSHTRFLAHPSEASGAIEALKFWLRRDGGVDWPYELRRGDADVFDVRMAVLNAQWQRLVDIETSVTGRKKMISLQEFASKAAARSAWDDFETCHFNQVQAALGRRLRNALERQRIQQLGA